MPTSAEQVAAKKIGGAPMPSNNPPEGNVPAGLLVGQPRDNRHRSLDGGGRGGGIGVGGDGELLLGDSGGVPAWRAQFDMVATIAEEDSQGTIAELTEEEIMDVVVPGRVPQ
mmetsp:Transcript_14394/g.35947  ORF Transcript_14394/g.35947 Transcript_14394/m.35947 type:complete len:112 (+) Transcript_14394:1-336(+)